MIVTLAPSLRCDHDAETAETIMLKRQRLQSTRATKMAVIARLTAPSIVIFIVVAYHVTSKHCFSFVHNKGMLSDQQRRLAVSNTDDSTVREREVRNTLRIGLARDDSGGYVGTTLSDLAYLDHCNFLSLNNDEFIQFDSIMTERPIRTWRKLQWSDERIRDAHQEFTLELLEIYAQAHGMCNFQHYKPTVPYEATIDVSSILQQQQESIEYDSENYARLVIVIIAYKDAEHLFQLVEAVHMPQHFIVIHLERRCDTEYERYVRIRAQAYDNVVLLKFGSILYKTDLVTTVNLRIMRYLMDLELQFDYFVTLDGAAYPLYSARDLARALKRSNRHVFLGELKHFGRKVDNIDWAYNNVLHRFTLTHTYGDGEKGYQPLKPSRKEANLPIGDMRYFLKSKTNSGNTAVYSYETVKQLLTSTMAMKIHSFHKYGCCHYPEETEWYAMLNSIFRGPETLQVGSMYQVWEEKLNRRGRVAISVSNAIQTSNPNQAYILADAYRREVGNIKYNRTETMTYLQEAKQRGFLFTRKFDSSNDESVQLRKWIQRQLHRNKKSPFLK